MPKRVIDFDALWASDKLAACAEWAQSEYAWLYGLADASGSFEITNMRVIWGRVAAIRKNLSLERLEEIFGEFIARGLLFTWVENGKRYGHWTGSDVPGRLPAPSWRARLEKLAPPVPRDALAAYSAQFGGSREGIAARAKAMAAGIGAVPAARTATAAPSSSSAAHDARSPFLKAHLEETQAQDWDSDLDWKKEVSAPAHSERDSQELRMSAPARETAQQPPAWSTPRTLNEARALHAAAEAEFTGDTSAEELLAIYNSERGELPLVLVLTDERRARCAGWLAAGGTAEEFRAAVRRAGATPFLAGSGARGWHASFDWLVADPENARKVLAGEYEPAGRTATAVRTVRRGESRRLADLYAGTGPSAAEYGVRVNPAALERIRARQARADQRSAAAALAAAAGSSPAAQEMLSAAASAAVAAPAAVSPPGISAAGEATRATAQEFSGGDFASGEVPAISAPRAIACAAYAGNSVVLARSSAQARASPALKS